MKNIKSEDKKQINFEDTIKEKDIDNGNYSFVSKKRVILFAGACIMILTALLLIISYVVGSTY